jgi:hypothetical protein
MIKLNDAIETQELNHKLNLEANKNKLNQTESQLEDAASIRSALELQVNLEAFLFFFNLINKKKTLN